MRALWAGLIVAFLSVTEAAGSLLRANGHASLLENGHGERGRGRGGSYSAARQAARQEEFQAMRVKNSLAEVIEILGTMLKEFSDQEVEDKANWDKYSKWSDDSETEKNAFIQEQSALIMSKTAQMNANKQMVQTLTHDLAQLTTDIAETEESIRELITMRKEERAQFEITMKDLTKTIKAVTKATEILEGHYATNAAGLEQIKARVQMALATHRSRASDSELTMRRLSSLLQQASSGGNPDYLNVDGASKYGSYEKQGGAGGVIGMLNDLRSDLESQRQDTVAKENDSQRQFEETKHAKEVDLGHMKKTKSDKQTKKTECEATIQECASTIAQAEKEVQDARDYVALLLQDREKFTKQFKDRTTMRKAEQAATQAALDALQAVSAGAKAAVGDGASASASFIQIAQSSKRVTLGAKAGARLSREMTKLVALGKQLKSTALVQMASKLKDDYMTSDQASFFDAGSFGPVMKLLSDLISRLETEQAAETSQHDWCENEKTNSVASKDEREKNLKSLKASIESYTTTIAGLKTEVLALESEIARVEEETRIAKDIRSSEHEVFVQAKKDHDEVIGAIKTALEALSGQYALIQLGHRASIRRQAPGGDTPFAEYSSGSGGAGSAMEMLEDLSGRYKEALGKIVADENAAQEAHEDLLDRNAQFIAETTNTRNTKISERRQSLTELNDNKNEMKTNLIELHEASKYLMDLRPSCDDIRSTFEERKARREAEIQALKEAVEVLQDPSAMGQ